MTENSNVKVDSCAKSALSPTPCCASDVVETGLTPELDPVRRGGMIPFSFSREEKEEVINYIRSLGPQYQNSTVILDKRDIPEDLLDQLSFANLTESEVQNVSRQCLDGMRRCKDRSRDSQSDSCSQ